MFPETLNHASRLIIMSSPKTIHWGIRATGGVAIASQRTPRIPQRMRLPVFSTRIRLVRGAGRDPDVDIIYIATPHSHHYQNAMLYLEAGKNMLVKRQSLSTQTKRALQPKRQRRRTSSGWRRSGQDISRPEDYHIRTHRPRAARARR